MSPEQTVLPVENVIPKVPSGLKGDCEVCGSSHGYYRIFYDKTLCYPCYEALEDSR